MSIRERGQKEKGTGGGEKPTNRGEGGWTENRAAWDMSIPKDKCKCLFSSPWKFSTENINIFSSILQSKPWYLLACAHFRRKYGNDPQKAELLYKNCFGQKIKPLLHWNNYKNFKWLQDRDLEFACVLGRVKPRYMMRWSLRKMSWKAESWSNVERGEDLLKAWD